MTRRPRPLIRKLLIPLAAAVGLVAILVAAAFVLVRPDDLKEKALARARAATGYGIEAGAARLHLGWSGVGVRVADIAVTAPDGTQDLQLDQLDLHVKLLPLLSRRVELRGVVLERPRFTWREAPPAGRPSRPSGPSPVLGVFAVESWNVREGSYTQESGQGTLSLTGIDMAGGLTLRPTLAGEGRVEGRAASGSWRSGDLNVPLPPFTARGDIVIAPGLAAFRFPRLEVEAGEIRLAMEGEVKASGGGYDWMFHGSAPAVSWPALRALVPAERLASLASLDLNLEAVLSELRLAGTTRRNAAGEPIPADVNGSLLLSQVSARRTGASLGLTDGKAEVSFTRTRVDLGNGQAKVGATPLTFSGSVLLEPTRHLESFRVAGDIPASVLAGLCPADMECAFSEGTLALDVDLSGALPFTADRVPQAKGQINVTDLTGRWKALDLAGVSGVLRLESDHGVLEDLRGRLGRLVIAGVGGRVVPHGPGVAVEDLKGRLYDGAMQGRMTFVRRAGETVWGYEGDVDVSEVSLDHVVGAWMPRNAAALITGKASSRVTFAGDWERGVTTWSSLKAEGGVDLREGSFRDLPGLMELARTLGVQGTETRGWGFRDLAASFQLEAGRVHLPRLTWRQEGLAWNLEGAVGLDASLALTGTVTADPQRITLPAQIAPLAPYMADDDGRIPISFRVGGTLKEPQVSVDWEGLAARAAERVRGQESKRLEEQLKKTVKDPAALEKLKKLLGGRGGKP